MFVSAVIIWMVFGSRCTIWFFFMVMDLLCLLVRVIFPFRMNHVSVFSLW